MRVEKKRTKQALILTANERSTLKLYLSDLKKQMPGLHPLQRKVSAQLVAQFNEEHHVPDIMHHIVDTICTMQMNILQGGQPPTANEINRLQSLHALYTLLANLWESRSLKWVA